MIEENAADRLDGAPHPRERQVLIGHAEAERQLLDAYRGPRMHHAWLIGGPEGIGKATLAYRFARFVLANPVAARIPAEVDSLAVPEDHPVARRIVAGSHTDLLALRRIAEVGKDKIPQEISVNAMRDIVRFFGSTAGEGGWRICIVDAADDLNRSSANALLKLLEEPPPRSLFLIVAHLPGRLLPTIRSRCRMLHLHPLTSDEIVAGLQTFADIRLPDDEAARISALADGSLRRALELVLHHHRDFLSERQAAYRPRLRDDRHRRAGALPAPRRQGRLLPHRHRRARHQDAADGAQGGADPRELADRNSAEFRAWRGAEHLQRRLHPHHRAAPLRREPGDLARHGANGDIYKGGYAGWYSVRDEAYYGEEETELSRRRRPLRPQGTPVEWVEEESYFFRSRPMQDSLLELYEKRSPGFIAPAERRNEVISFVKSGLKDLSVSRTTFDWGVPVPGDEKHVMYVWVDALTNYITGAGYPDENASVGYWPADVTSSARTSCASTPSTGRPS
jgi:DNA polymerase-3 subunit delta'